MGTRERERERLKGLCVYKSHVGIDKRSVWWYAEYISIYRKGEREIVQRGDNVLVL